MKKILYLLWLLLWVVPAFAQTDPDDVNDDIEGDTISLVKDKRPGRAALMSAVVPGLGQMYNKKLWKLPIIYGGIGSLLYMINSNNARYNVYLEAYANKNTPGPIYFDDYYQGLLERSDRELEYFKKYYRRQRDLTVIYLAGVYAANIVDAMVDAHLRNYDVNDDLVLKLQPALISTSFSLVPSIKLSLNF